MRRQSRMATASQPPYCVKLRARDSTLLNMFKRMGSHIQSLSQGFWQPLMSHTGKVSTKFLLKGT